MACGLVLCAIVNVGLGFSTAFWIFAALVVLNGLFQGMGVGPSFITIANWFPRRSVVGLVLSGISLITSVVVLFALLLVPLLPYSAASTGKVRAISFRPAWLSFLR